MELIVQILMLFIVINTVLKLSFWKWWQAVLFGAACAAFIAAAYGYAILQSKTQLADYLADKLILQDMAVLITLESVISIAFCFAAINAIHTGKRRVWLRILGWYPGLLIFPVLFYLLTQTIFALPGTDFKLTSYLLAAGALIVIPSLAVLVKRLYPEREMRLEVHFLVSLFVCAIGLITTVNGNVTYVHAAQPINIKAIVLSAGLFLTLFLSGMLWNKIKWNIKRKKR